MKFVISTVICFFLALAHSKEFESRTRSNNTGTMVNKNIPKLNPGLVEYSNQIRQYVVLLLEKNVLIRGTAFIVTSNTIITTSINLEEIKIPLTFRAHQTGYRYPRRVLYSYHHDPPFTKARFEPELEGEIPLFKQNIFIPRSRKPRIGEQVFSLGFTEKKMFKKKLGILKQYVKNGWGVKLNKDNSAYHTLPGDVLVIDGKILGFLVNVLHPERDDPLAIYMYPDN